MYGIYTYTYIEFDTLTSELILAAVFIIEINYVITILFSFFLWECPFIIYLTALITNVAEVYSAANMLQIKGTLT